MLASLQDQLALQGSTIAIAVAVILMASLVRGFSGFGLTALIMAGLTLFIPPIALIPLCHMLEFTAGLVMLKASRAKADKRIVFGLAIGAVVGMPIGLATTVAVSENASRMIALSTIAVLAVLQLLNKTPKSLDTSKGLYLSGLLSGITTGLSGAGGLVVALYVLALNRPPAQIRASVVMYLFITFFTSGVWLLYAGLMDLVTLKRWLIFSPMVIVGVLIGTHLFQPAMEPWYKRICLCLLLGLAIAGLSRL